MLGNRIVGRYPLRPFILELALLYLHAALVLAILVITALFVKYRHIQVTSASSEEGDADSVNSVSALELARMRLTRPLTVDEAPFMHGSTGDNNVELSMRTTEIDIFDEKPVGKRLRIGTIDT